MFGYIKPFKPEMKIAEYDTYKAVYCGLCKQLGKSYGPLARLTLSYDFTFLAMLKMSISDESYKFSKQSCAVNPLKKCFCFHENDVLDFGSAVAIMLLYYKVKDNIADEHFLKKLFYMIVYPIASHANKKAVLNYPEVDTILKETMPMQAILEAENSDSIDRACEPTALSLGRIFELLSEDENQRRILYRLGYLMGRFIYMCDALDDIESDIKNKSYNPFVIYHSLLGGELDKISAIEEEGISSLNLTIAELGLTFELLDIKKYRPILGNIIYLGLKSSVREIKLKRSKRNDRPL